MKTMENVVMHFGPREKICWWVPSGHPEGDSWLTIEQRRLSFRLGIGLCHCGSTDSFGLDHSHILDALHSQRHVSTKELFRWFHRTLFHKGALQLRFDWNGWRPWNVRDRAALWDWLIDCAHLKLNPHGDDCSCWCDG